MRRWRCHTCGETFKHWAPAERHADTHGGARLECLDVCEDDESREAK